MIATQAAREVFNTVVDSADAIAERAREAVCRRMWGESFDETTNRLIRDSQGKHPEDGGLWMVKTGRGWERVRPLVEVAAVVPTQEGDSDADGCMFDDTLPGSPERVAALRQHEENNKGESSAFIWTDEEIMERLCEVLARGSKRHRNNRQDVME